MRDSVILNDTHLNEASSFRPEHKIQMRRETRPAPTPPSRHSVKRGSVLDLVPFQVLAGDLRE